ncbi:MAG: DUF1705 domain-containing protein, partial [Deltaproteobacteria bacterium]|nr:DUF1705 domain-containing protein [Deltaproteobacteria bacterium]
MLKDKFKLPGFVLLMSSLNFLLFHYPFFSFVFDHVDFKRLNGILIIISLVILMLLANAFTFYLLFFLSRVVGKFLLVLFFIINAVAIYFVNTYGVIIDESMIGNVLNTNYEEASGFFSVKLLLYVFLLGVIPSIYIIKAKIVNVTLKRFLTTSSLALLLMIVIAYANASNWLWIDKNSKQLGGLAMPWSYAVNISLFYIHDYQKNKKEILLPDATIKDDGKAIVVLVIGESAR